MRLIDCIREEMNNAGYDWYFTKDSDPHMSEYVNDYYKFRSIISGFTGSNGTLAVGIDKAYLFTDGRYFIQAEKELEGSGIELMKLSTPGYPMILLSFYPLNLQARALKRRLKRLENI